MTIVSRAVPSLLVEALVQKVIRAKWEVSTRSSLVENSRSVRLSMVHVVHLDIASFVSVDRLRKHTANCTIGSLYKSFK